MQKRLIYIFTVHLYTVPNCVAIVACRQNKYYLFASFRASFIEKWIDYVVCRILFYLLLKLLTYLFGLVGRW